MKALREGAADEGGLGAAVEAEEDADLVNDKDAVVFEFVGGCRTATRCCAARAGEGGR